MIEENYRKNPHIVADITLEALLLIWQSRVVSLLMEGELPLKMSLLGKQNQEMYVVILSTYKTSWPVAFELIMSSLDVITHSTGMASRILLTTT